jgi:hypothetical protein
MRLAPAMRASGTTQAAVFWRALRRHRGEIVRFTLALVFLCGGLWALSFGIDRANTAYWARIEADKAAAMAFSRRQAAALRTGSIFHVGEDSGCDRIRFDNRNGSFVDIEPVDCKEWWHQEASELQRASKSGAAPRAGGMRGMLDSFKK